MKLFQCTKCCEFKEQKEFAKDKYSSRGFTYNCKNCRNNQYKKYRLENKDKVKARNDKNKEKRKQYYAARKDYHRDLRFQREFGITLERYNEIKDEQNSVCAICQRTEQEATNLDKNLAVDHCHTTKKVRGLLCSKCNTAVAMFKEDVETLEKAINYLKER